MSFTIRPEYHFIERDGKTLLAVYIPECPDQFKPCYYKPKGLPGGACIRDGNTDRTMTEEEMRHLIDNSKKLKFDSTKAEGITLDDLSKEKILKLVQRSSERTQRNIAIEDINFELMKNLGVLDTFDSEECPTVGGFLIFAKEREI